MGNQMGMCPFSLTTGSLWYGQMGAGLLASPARRLVRGLCRVWEACLLPERLCPVLWAPLVCRERTFSPVAQQRPAKRAVGPALMVVFCIFRLRPHSKWDAAAVTWARSWAAIQKQPGFHAPDRLRGGIAAGTIGAGEGWACQQVSGPVRGYAGWSWGLSGLEGGQRCCWKVTRIWYSLQAACGVWILGFLMPTKVASRRPFPKVCGVCLLVLYRRDNSLITWKTEFWRNQDVKRVLIWKCYYCRQI